MTISNDAPRVQLVADGTTGPFPFKFRIFSEEDVRVFDGATQKALTTDYAVDFDFLDDDADEGSINFVSGQQPANSAIITIDRAIPTERPSDLQQSGKPVQVELNIDLDKIWAKLQELVEVFKRLVRLSDTTAFTGDVIFPDGGATESGKVVGWSSDGLSLENKELVSGGLISLPLIVGEGGTGAASAADARSNLGAVGASGDESIAGAKTFTGKVNLDGPVALGDGSELTIAAGAITPTGNLHRVDTQADEATDDLTTINTANVEDGALLVLQPANDARTVVVKHAASPAAGEIVTADGRDVTLDDIEDMIVLKRRGAFWEEVSRSGRTYPVGTVVQTQIATTTSEFAITATIPIDATPPQNNEGSEVLTRAITPRFASSKLKLTLTLCLGNTSTFQHIAALFQDDDTDAIAASYLHQATGTGEMIQATVVWIVDAVNTDARTYKVRVGDNGGTVYINRSSSVSNLFGADNLQTVLTIEEIAQ